MKENLPAFVEHFEDEIKDLTNQGHKPMTFAFILAKLGVGKRLRNVYGIETQWDFRREDTLQLKLTVLFAKLLTRFFDGEKLGLILLKLSEVKYLFTKPTVHTMDGLKFFLNWKDRKSRYIFEDYKNKTAWEETTTNLIKATLNEGETAVDVGASVGPITMQFARQVGEKGKVYSFEPTKRCFTYLKKNVELNGFKNVEAFNLGAWDKTETVGMPRCDVHPTFYPCVSLDEFLEEKGILKVDYLKMDIDGSEPWALRGLVRTFERNPEMRIICEYYPKYILKAGGDPNEVLDILGKYFDLYTIPDDYGDGYCNLYGTRKHA